MKKLIPFVALVLMAVIGHAQTWKSDPAHSRLAFSVKHMSISEITGNFKSFEATVQSSKPDFSDAVINLKADVNSINTEVEMRDNHLKSADFFDAAQFPELSFKSNGIRKTGKDTYTVTGDLTLHGVTKPVTVKLLFNGTALNPQSKKTIAGFQVTGTIKRSDFGIGSKFPPAAVSDEVTIKADGEFSQP